MLGRMLRRYKELPQGGRWAIGLLGLIVAFNLLGFALEAMYGGAPEGPASSTFTTDAEGTAAYAELLERNGKEVVQLREEPATADLDPGSTLFLLSPGEVSDPDARALADFTSGGGRLVVAVDRPAQWLRSLMRAPPIWSGSGSASGRALVPVEETHGVDAVRGSGSGSWERAGGSLPILGDETVATTVAQLERGRVVLIADATIVQNGYLGGADNATFALAIAGDRTQAVFAETFHGYDKATGFAALPERARWTLALLAVAVAIVMFAHARRFGPPDRVQREFPPARRVYVDALASTLGKMRDRDTVVAPLRSRARMALARRLNVPTDASDEMLLESARRRELEEEAKVVLRPVRTEDDVLQLGRVAVRTIRGVH